MNKNYIKNIIFLIFISIIFTSCASTTKDVKQFNYIDGKSKESFYSNLKEDDLLKATKTLLFALENNSDGQKLKNLFSNIEKIDLSNDALDIMEVSLLTNAHYPNNNISENEFLKFKSDWLIKNL